MKKVKNILGWIPFCLGIGLILVAVLLLIALCLAASPLVLLITALLSLGVVGLLASGKLEKFDTL